MGLLVMGKFMVALVTFFITGLMVFTWTDSESMAWIASTLAGGVSWFLLILQD